MQTVQEFKKHVPSVRFSGGYARGIRPVPVGASGQLEVRDAVGDNYAYQELTMGGRLIDTNNPEALGEHREFLMCAHGSLLVSGVGLGGFLYRALRKPNVDYVTVVEPNIHLIHILEAAFEDFADKLTFVNCRVSDIVNSHVYDVVYAHKTSTE